MPRIKSNFSRYSPIAEIGGLHGCNGDAGRMIREIRKEMGITQKEFGSLFGKSQAWVAETELGDNATFELAVRMLRGLVAHCGVSPSFLLDGTLPVFVEENGGGVQAQAVVRMLLEPPERATDWNRSSFGLLHEDIASSL